MQFCSSFKLTPPQKNKRFMIGGRGDKWYMGWRNHFNKNKYPWSSSKADRKTEAKRRLSLAQAHRSGRTALFRAYLTFAGDPPHLSPHPGALVQKSTESWAPRRSSKVRSAPRLSPKLNLPLAVLSVFEPHPWSSTSEVLLEHLQGWADKST